jgi:hypothetical protein
MRASEDEDIVRRAFANVGIGKSSPADPPPVDSLDAYGANGHHAVNRHWNGTPDRHPKGTPLIGES